MDMMDMSYFRILLLFSYVGFASSQDFTSERQSSSSTNQKCDSKDPRYRELDGSCNHRLGYGSTMQPVRRLLKPQYADGQDSPRAYSVFGREFPLPSPRLISMKLHQDNPKSSRFTLLVMQLGQLVDHDMTMAPTPAEGNETVKCCNLPPRQFRPPDCFTIDVPPSDPVFKDCMEFVRSKAAHDSDGRKIVPREQSNALTAFLDASFIYGDHLKTLNKLRTQNGKGALLKTRMVNGKVRLPKDPSNNSDCVKTRHPLSYCQMAGDSRVNEQPGLSSLHLLFHLQHNKIVRSLVREKLRGEGKRSNMEAVNNYIKRVANRKKEKLFQETRKIMSGILQKITYCDWLPLVVGPRLIQKYKLGCDKPCTYDPKVDPRVTNVFLSAAFRFGHSLIPNKILIDYRLKSLTDMFSIPDASIFHFESIVFGLCQKNMSPAVDRFVSQSVTSSLFQTSMKSLDLVALNIQRGRDHGIPPYYYWKKYYKLKRFAGMEQFGSSTVAKTLRGLYRHPRDVDLFTAGLLEKPLPGGMVGETFGNILAHQFSQVKFGDAFFFLGTKKPQCFTPDQRKAIKAVSMAQLMCTTTGMDVIQENPFIERSARNPFVLCEDLPTLDVTPWIHEI